MQLLHAPLGATASSLGNTVLDSWVRWNKWTSMCVFGSIYTTKAFRMRWLLKRWLHKSLHTDHILGELDQAEEDQYSLIAIHLLSLWEITQKCLNSGRKQSLYVFTRVTKLHHNNHMVCMQQKTVVITNAYRRYQLHTKFYSISYYNLIEHI